MSHLHHKVSALVDGELSSSARGRALAHARACPPCRQEIAETLKVKRRLHQLAPIELSDDLLQLVSSGALSCAPQIEPDRSPLLRWFMVSAGSLSAVVIVIAYVVGAPVPAQPRQVSPSVEEFAVEFADSTGLAPLADPVVDLQASPPDTGSTAPIGFTAAGITLGPAAEGAATAPYNEAPVVAQTGDDHMAVRLLRKAALAPQRLAFSGVRVVMALMPAGVQRSIVRVRHNPEQGTSFVVPGKNASSRAKAWFVPETDEASSPAPDRAVDQLAVAYDIHLDGAEIVDGRRAVVVTAAHGEQVSARFWIDEATGLLLRKTMYVDGQMVRWSGYTSMAMGDQVFMPHLPPETPAPSMTSLSTDAAAALTDRGWTCPQWLTADFRLLSLHEMDTDGGVMHAEYTDGMSTVSVFEERGELADTPLSDFRPVTMGGRIVYLREGLPMVAVWQTGDRVFTLVTDAPEQMMGSLIERFPSAGQPQTHGAMSRIGHGLSRMASAVAP